ncbi:MAG: hypothetical protein ACK564_04510 [Novosphingobium sp.]|uniref:hypothetical protein n=1 Tax=Novosphingobium sp. TaxID=1874826 RepID=UPI00391BA721|nr:hypothetical protein [Novosphingobium sp.]
MAINFARNSGIVEKRRAPRAPLGIDASMRERGRTALDVKVLTFSAFGCQVTGFLPTSGEGQAWLKLPGLESQAVTVIWNNGQHIGVEFERPLHPSVAARYLPAAGSHAANYAAANPAANDRLLSRREQIMAGIVASDFSPLQRTKKPSKLGMFGKISRMTVRKADHRNEPRYGDNLHQGPSKVMIDGESGSVRNVSASGIRAFMPHVLDREIGDKVPVEFDGFEPIKGRIVWMNQTELGISLPLHTIELFDAN